MNHSGNFGRALETPGFFSDENRHRSTHNAPAHLRRRLRILREKRPSRADVDAGPGSRCAVAAHPRTHGRTGADGGGWHEQSMVRQPGGRALRRGSGHQRRHGLRLVGTPADMALPPARPAAIGRLGLSMDCGPSHDDAGQYGGVRPAASTPGL